MPLAGDRHLSGASEQVVGALSMADATAAPAAPQYKVDAKLLLAAPGHTGLPDGGTVIVQRMRYDSALVSWVYDVILIGGGSSGSDVKFLESVREGWLRHEGRIAVSRS